MDHTRPGGFMLDMPLAPSTRGFDIPGGTRAQPATIWTPGLVLVPVWRLERRDRLIKRVMDVAIALAGLILTAPLVLVITAAIRRESPGPILFRQERVGLDGTLFTLLKFRTMYDHAQSPGILRQATRDDPRVTRVGRWLRRGSFDELPQLINVLIGDMSIVGPRPHAPGTRAGGRLFEDVSHRYRTRHCVKPGMTGLAQVRGWRGETDTEEKLVRRLESDLEYIATWSTALDLRIIGRTAISLMRMRNAY
jgi:polysaccharide biosynthesis protein PslA